VIGSALIADPHEEEILFAPLTGLEVHGFRVEGSVLVVEAKMSVNLNALTIEQVVSKRRKVVQDMCDQVMLRFEHEIPKRPAWQALVELRGDAVQLATATLQRQLDGLSRRDAEHYNEDASLGDAITRAVASVGHAEAWPDSRAKLARTAEVRLTPRASRFSACLCDTIVLSPRCQTHRWTAWRASSARRRSI
jgi:hypothetical protein